MFLGVFEHHYNTKFKHAIGISTHYVVLAFELHIDSTTLQVPMKQHERYDWLAESAIGIDPGMHPYVLDYFSEHKGYRT